jgi:hypothetical protein
MKLLVVSHIRNHQFVVKSHLKVKSISIYATCYGVSEDCNTAVDFDPFGPRFKFVTAFTKATNVASV